MDASRYETYLLVFDCDARRSLDIDLNSIPPGAPCLISSYVTSAATPVGSKG